ncbi:hypothetical protein [Leptospira sp. GIMC2001]|uniref:hypothetical protein n=1 Tax=Leptospira sp. GIMC2001 TaxID=1513297 RepID=UPI00234A8A26|nr:hypothetical protein [Leptospira sp. GIMC2001]WCL49376.1 hypothetical protein O4O04_19115 [Leptospira sp. GIMC2001]
MLNDERRNNFTLRVSIDSLKNLIDTVDRDEKPTKDDIATARQDLELIVEAVTNYHARFKELLETVNDMKELDDRLDIEK